MSKSPETPEDFAGRLRLAIAAKRVTRSRTGREAGLRAGYIFRLLGDAGESKQILAPGPEIVRQLADYLGVGYEWLAIGRGPMHADDWAPTPLEEATTIARRLGVRQDAIDATAERFRDDDDEMTTIDWIVAFNDEARRLDKRRVPRPEVKVRGERLVARLSAKRERKLREATEAEAEAAQRRREAEKPSDEPAKPKRRRKR